MAFLESGSHGLLIHLLEYRKNYLVAESQEISTNMHTAH